MPNCRNGQQADFLQFFVLVVRDRRSRDQNRDPCRENWGKLERENVDDLCITLWIISESEEEQG
jgi:hypothetical protein